ncbi:MAG: DUF1491 family protein [Pseudomonadota bacterium]
MRLRSDIFVASLLRSAESRGSAGTVLRKGRTSLGSVYVVGFDRTTRSASLWAPAPQALVEMDGDARQAPVSKFEERLTEVVESEISAFIEKEASFDDDIWVVELECAPQVIRGLIDVVDAPRR